MSFALQEFNRAVGQITASDQVRRRAGAPLLDQLTEQANVLHSIFNSSSPLAAAAGEEADAVGDYARSILTLSELLDRASQTGDIDLVTSVAADLELKIRFAQSKIGATNAGLPGRVQVEVRTERGGKPESGYTIRLYPSFPPFRNDETRARRFSNPSTPTTENVVPGTYVARAYRDGVLAHEEVVQIGADLTAHQRITLPIKP